MLRFLRTHITGLEAKNDEVEDFCQYTKLMSHGFPQKISCFAIDKKLSLIAFGTRDGRIIIMGNELIEWEGRIDSNLPIVYIYFASELGILHLLCDDYYSTMQSFHRCRIQGDKLELKKVVHQKHLKKITCAEMLDRNDGNSALLIGTIIGNVYALWSNSMELSEYIVFEDTELKNISNLADSKSVDKIIVDSTTLYILFNNNFIVVYDSLHNEVHQTFALPLNATNMFLFTLKSTLIFSYANGSFSAYDLVGNCMNDTCLPFGPYSCMPINKIYCLNNFNFNSELFIFSGGMPKASYGDHYTISVFSHECKVVFDFNSRILDFIVLYENGNGTELFVLCEQEMVVIDLTDRSYKCFRLPYFYPIHYSPVTSIYLTSTISEKVVELLKLAHSEQHSTSNKCWSSRSWPITCGSDQLAQTFSDSKNMSILFTGHENGTIHLWRTDRLSFSPFFVHKTAYEFDGFFEGTNVIEDEHGTSLSESEMDERNDEWPPFKKVGLFDPFCDDPRLTIVKIFFDVHSGELIVGGRAGQAMVYELNQNERKFNPINCISIDFTEHIIQANERSISRNRQLPMPGRSICMTYTPGFQPMSNCIVQMKPASNITAISYLSERKLLVVGNEYGYAVCSIDAAHLEYKNCLLTTNEIVELSNVDATLSRFKSMKKTIRQSFRRKKRIPIDQNGRVDGALSPSEEIRPIEREIAARTEHPNIHQGELPLSLIKVACFITTRSSSNPIHHQDSLLIGTQGGVILIHTILLTKDLNEELCPLVKEIRLQHRAPIVHIDYLPDPYNRILVFSEEQIRSFTMPLMRPSKYKFKLTSLEGSRIRKAQIVSLRNLKNKRIVEKFILIVSNHGELFVFSSYNPRKYVHIPFTKATDILGIASSAINQEGEIFFLKSGGSEFQRASLGILLNATSMCLTKEICLA